MPFSRLSATEAEEIQEAFENAVCVLSHVPIVSETNLKTNSFFHGLRSDTETLAKCLQEHQRTHFTTWHEHIFYAEQYWTTYFIFVFRFVLLYMILVLTICFCTDNFIVFFTCSCSRKEQTYTYYDILYIDIRHIDAQRCPSKATRAWALSSPPQLVEAPLEARRSLAQCSVSWGVQAPTFNGSF